MKMTKNLFNSSNKKTYSSRKYIYLSNNDRYECFVGGDDCTVIITKLFYQYTHTEK